MRNLLKWILQYNKAFTAFFGVPLITYLVQNLAGFLAENGLILPDNAVVEINSAVLWLIALAVAGGVYQIPNGSNK